MNIFPDWTLFLQIAAFLVLIRILNSVIYKPIRGILEKRRAIVKDLQHDAVSLQQKGYDGEKEFESQLAKAKAQGLEQREAYTKAAKEFAGQIVAEIQAKAKVDIDSVRARAISDAQDARRQLESQMRPLSLLIAEKILGRPIA